MDEMMAPVSFPAAGAPVPHCRYPLQRACLSAAHSSQRFNCCGCHCIYRQASVCTLTSSPAEAASNCDACVPVTTCIGIVIYP